MDWHKKHLTFQCKLFKVTRSMWHSDFFRTILYQIKIPGSNFDDSDDSNAEGIWQNEYPEQLDQFDDDLYEFQDEDEAQGKI